MEEKCGGVVENSPKKTLVANMENMSQKRMKKMKMKQKIRMQKNKLNINDAMDADKKDMLLKIALKIQISKLAHQTMQRKSKGSKT
jgi:hypothetical protein